jgi:hypothetical protein
MQTLKNIGNWLRDNPWAIIVALASIFSAYLIYKRKDNKISSLEDAVVVQSTKRKIAAVEAKAEVLKQQADAKAPEVAELDRKVAESKRRVVEIHEGRRLEELNDDEVARMFSDARL